MFFILKRVLRQKFIRRCIIASPPRK